MLERVPDARRRDPQARALVASMTRTFGQPPVQLRTLGGTVPIAPFIEALGFPALLVPTVNFDNNQHEENENLRLGAFFDSIVTIAAVLRMGAVVRIDINCDMGESFGPWRMGADAQVMPHITSANIACGAHAGDPSVMRRTVRMARAAGGARSARIRASRTCRDSDGAR